LTLQLNEHWLLIQEDHKKRAKQLEVAFDKNDELEKKINQLQDERLNFRAKQRQADWSMSRQDTQSAEQRVNQKVEWSSTFEAHFQRESFTLSENENDHHKFIKLLNSLIFETDDSIWKTWNIKIADKLDVNTNHYSTEKIRIVYVIFRLEDDADQQIYAKHCVMMLSYSINHYQSYWNIWKKLTKIRIWFESVVANTLLWSSSTSLSALSIQNSLEYSAFWTTTISLWWTTFRIKSTIIFRMCCQFVS